MLLISIHALLAESDNVGRVFAKAEFYFYPRSPCGERPGKESVAAALGIISIHALLAESDAGG